MAHHTKRDVHAERMADIMLKAGEAVDMHPICDQPSRHADLLQTVRPCACTNYSLSPLP